MSCCEKYAIRRSAPPFFILRQYLRMAGVQIADHFGHAPSLSIPLACGSGALARDAHRHQAVMARLSGAGPQLPPCHRERSEGSGANSTGVLWGKREVLLFAQDDK